MVNIARELLVTGPLRTCPAPDPSLRWLVGRRSFKPTAMDQNSGRCTRPDHRVLYYDGQYVDRSFKRCSVKHQVQQGDGRMRWDYGVSTAMSSTNKFCLICLSQVVQRQTHYHSAVQGPAFRRHHRDIWDREFERASYTYEGMPESNTAWRVEIYNGTRMLGLQRWVWL